ncbi:uncharacterized protein LOC126965435 [Leptidea sinapis]|uniref:uncharacterized protein LOC126965435 n=1 Tax=Leptidea sinapis TaxID=189913 RepID=UPI0021293DCE|nr:uncharacterized protein LOC126965435 [Leptidea sinapis]
MADSFFGFDTSLSNLNDDDCGAEPSEEEYDALNDETFGHEEDFDWEVEHEQHAEQMESSRRQNEMDEADSRLEASLSQLVLDDTDTTHKNTLGSSVWRHDLFPAHQPVQPLKNVCTVEELERQLRQNQPQHNQQQVQPPQNFQQNYFQPRFPPVILQRPPGLQAPVSLPFAPQPIGPNNPLNQPVNKPFNQSTQITTPNQMQMQMQNHLPQNMNPIGPIGQNMNQFMQSNHQFQNNQMCQGMMNQMQQNMNQAGPNMNQIGPNITQMGQMNQQNQLFPSQSTHNQMAPKGLNNQMGQNVGPNLNQMGQNMNQMGQNVNQMGQNINQVGQNVMNQNMNQMPQNMNQMPQNMNQMSQNMNHKMPNGNFGPNQYQSPHMMGQPRMMGPGPMPNIRQIFPNNMNQFNPNFRGPPPAKTEPTNQNTKQMNHKQTGQPMNQTINPPVNQSASKSPTKRQDPKIKSRVYNNSNKTLTSENLVQIIQNTHPMLVYNSYHNANHHPMLHRNSYSNNQMPPMMSQRNGGFNNNVSGNSHSDESSVSSEDEYACLMTQREKQWLVNIQMLQLNTGTPYIHDFYYTVFLERQQNKAKEGVKEAHKANQQNHPFYSGGVKQEEHHRGSRERHNSHSHRHNSTSEDPPRTYVPTQFENSLGKLQCGSVTAPRKIIDVELVSSEPAAGAGSRAPSVASTTHPAEVPREMKRTKQLLLDIEALYLILLRLEELNDPLAISNALILKEREEKQKQLEAAQKDAENQEENETNVFLKNIESVQRRPKQDSPKSDCVDKRQVVSLAVSQKPPVKNLLDEDKDDLLNKMFVGLLNGDRLQQMLTARKGRVLVSRFLRRVPPTHSRLRALWCKVLRALAASKRDLGLAVYSESYRKYIHNSSGWNAVLESCAILSEALDPARVPYALTSALTLSCVCALTEKAMVLTNTPEATSSERQWFRFLKTVARALKHTSLAVAKPVSPLNEKKLFYHIKLMDSRSTVEILQRGKKTSEFGDLTKSDVSELLIRYLC